MDKNILHSILPSQENSDVVEQTSVVPSDDHYKLLMAAKILSPVLSSENDSLKQENAKLIKTCSSLLNQLEECKKKLKDAQDVILQMESTSITSADPNFNYQYDILDYSEKATTKTVCFIWDELLNLTNITTNTDEYLVDCSSATIPIYIMLSNSQNIKTSLYCFTGTMKSFFDGWNNNVVSRIKDTKRAQELTVDYDSIKAEINKSPWKGHLPGSWRSTYNSSTKNKLPLRRALNIKTRMEEVFKAS